MEGNNGTRATNSLANSLLLGTEGSTASPIQMVTNGVARMTVLTDGKVGVGTSTPGTDFEVYNATAASEIQVNTSDGTGNARIALNTSGANWKMVSEAGTGNLKFRHDDGSGDLVFIDTGE